MRIYSHEKIFYVYQYLRKNNSKNGNTGTPYYIGKGCKDRAFSKNRHSTLPKDTNRIKFIAENLTEADAFQLEMLLIRLYGRIDLETGCLRNQTDGGDGISGFRHSLKTKQKQSISAKKRKPVSLEVRKRMSERMKNLSSEERQKLSLPRKKPQIY